ncbi:phosphonopyruvate decarboxylase [Clostridium sporogenes]|uniref:phosphonopyruvate decarboxylase n=1 Tax=Clostridium sporogenes TaxID=1509 RepID=UPI0013C8F816|nr:phosphonopyruvate decarboxylase [Clostridium sporogenes]NFQ00890.1 phosphonopyruvate decarboxylase [Clostridium sporogenes]NFQ40953.1 phosphonopyruvate decarboxylase [Clostridium sporogenes]
MNVIKFIQAIKDMNADFYTGIPDSQLKSLCNYLINTYKISKDHVIAANEGNAVALAAGYHLATGKIPCVYLQNSGLGNIINPVASLLNNKVYAIPCIFIVGWRGEPDVHDEPQHIFQGEITLKSLEVMDITYMVIDKNTTVNELENKIIEFKSLLDTGKSVAFVIKKGGLSYHEKVNYKNNNSTLREEIIHHITDVSKRDIIVSTTGKTSRELFEIREQTGNPHKYDFLTVGSMGHSSSIALGVALNKPNTRVWCIDGDGAAIMHMGAMAVIGSKSPNNYIHVLINNEAHESVGGQPTVANNINFGQIALGCGYKASYHATDINELDDILFRIVDKQGPIFIEVKCAIGSRDSLGRPTSTPIENKAAFMEYLRECD